jgi:haloacetate dehalogenase
MSASVRFHGYEDFLVNVDGVRIAGKISRAEQNPRAAVRPALLLLHGHPQTHLIWHRVAETLAEFFTVVIPDLRGYGASDKPASDPEHRSYSKRALAKDQAGLMAHFGAERGFDTFAICAHDRGARVAHRLMVDYPAAVSRALLLDIVPTVDMYDTTNRAFAEAYFHWFFLIQPYPLPEALIEANPRAYVENIIGSRYAGLAPFPPEVLDAYVRALERPGAVHAMCEDYRASATIDLVHDRLDRESGRRIETPLRILWGQHGVIAKLYEPLVLWSALASTVSGRPLDAGHYLPEEVPEEIVNEILDFVPHGS